jgi:hypothetical protein
LKNKNVRKLLKNVMNSEKKFDKASKQIKKPAVFKRQHKINKSPVKQQFEETIIIQKETSLLKSDLDSIPLERAKNDQYVRDETSEL